MAFTRVNIAIKPPQEVIEEAIKISNQIGKETEPFFILDGINFFPHITIYSPEYPDNNLDQVYKTVNEITSSTDRFVTTFTSFNSHLGYIDIALEKTEQWEKLHEAVVNKLNPYRENHVREKYKSSEELSNYSEIQQKYILDFGYSEVFSAFRPHLTITRLKDEQVAKEVVDKLNLQVHSFQVKELAAYLMGSHGTCTKLIREFSLK